MSDNMSDNMTDNMSEIQDENQQTGLEIAVIGMTGRFPGAGNIEEFWENLKNGKECLTFPTDEEIEEAGIQPELLNNPHYVRTKGGVFEGKEYFDAPLFGYTPLEAEIMDPQARKLHEGVWEALEDAGYNPEQYSGLIGLFAGASSNFYWEGLTLMSGKRHELGQFASAHITGREFLSTLVSYKLNLKGPAFTVLTACSTSLTAIHLACQSILNGECHIAVAGGVSVDHANSVGYLYQPGLILSKDGHCRAFDEKANGTAMGDGMALVVLKALEDALDDNDHIYAVVKGTALNNDGMRKGAYSAPSIEGQAEAIRAALQVAEVDPQSIGYIETHGTGTELGDPIEIEALKLAFGDVQKQYCAIGSVKTNVGHLDAAAGATGFIKAVLCLKHGFIPPSLNYERPNPKIDFQDSPFYVNTALTQWSNDDEPLRAGVSSFGIGGTNAHAVLEQAPLPQDEEDEATDDTSNNTSNTSNDTSNPYRLILLSARTPAALDRITRNLTGYIRENIEELGCRKPGGGDRLDDLAFTLQVGRKELPHRRMLVTRDINETLEILNSTGGEDMKTAVAYAGKPQVVFMFTGQGAQYENMGRELYRTEPRFRESMDRCFEILEPLMAVNIKEILYPPDASAPLSTPADSPINRTEFTQPLLFAFEYALAGLLMELGVEPYAMIGHSIGEYVAAHLSGVFSLEDALKLVVRRASLMQSMAPGKMLSVPMPAEEIQSLIDNRGTTGGDVCVAAVNSPGGCVLSGPKDALETFAQELQTRGIETRLLHTSHAFHSSMMDPMMAPFKESAAQLTFNTPEIPYISNVSGTWITVEEAADPAYWAEHVRKPVLFAKGIEELLKPDNVILVEVGPGKVLTTFVNQHPAKTQNHRVVNLVRHPKETVPDRRYLTEKIGQLWLYGKRIDWAAYHLDETLHRLPLPTYPFEQKRFWMEMDKGAGAPGQPGAGMFAAPSVKFDNGAGDEEERIAMNTQYAAPETDTERALEKIWREFLGFKQVGVLDDFFELGGDSLRATALAAKIHKELNVQVPVTQMFNTPTIRGLAGFIGEAAQDRFQTLEVAEEREYYPLSAAQKRLFLLQKMGLQGTAYNIPSMYILEGNLDREKLEHTFKRLLQRHAALRTSFDMVKGEPVQIVHPEVNFNIDYRAHHNGSAVDAAKAFVAPFNLSQPPMLRVGLFEEEPDRHLLIIDMHHIITDGASQGILTRDFMALYAGESLPPLRLQYKDYSRWQHSETIAAALDNQRQYWVEQFAGEIPQLQLPTDYPRPQVQNFNGNAVSFDLDKEKTERLHRLARAESATEFAVLLAIFNVLLAKLSGQEDHVVGIPAAGRQHADLQQIIGMFVNTLALRNRLEPGMTFSGFLAHVKDTTLKAMENQDYQFEDLVEQVNVPRDMSRNPLFDVMMVMQNTSARQKPEDAPEMDGVKIRPYAYDSQSAKFDLTLTVGLGEEQLSFYLQYAAALFKLETIERYTRYFNNITAAVLDNPHIPLPDIDILSPEEKEQLVVQFNATDSDYPREKNIHRLFEEQVERYPDNLAVAGVGFDADEGETKNSRIASMNYTQLNRRAVVLKRILQSKSVTPGSVVGLMVEHSIEMAAAIIGIFKAGASYLPIDPDYPVQRIAYMLRDSNAAAVVTTGEANSIGEKLEQWQGEVIPLDLTHGLPGSDEPEQTTDSEQTPDSPAYVIYTSGTTGRPKGVLLTHRNLVNYSCWFKKKTGLTAEDRSLLTSSYAFDLGYTSIYPPLLTGAAVHIVARETYLMPGRLLKYAAENRVSYLKITPSLLSVIVQHPEFTEENCRNLRFLVVGGEPINLEAVEKARSINPNLDVINHYGPTEATIGCIARYIDFSSWEEYAANPTIGGPIDNMKAFILDRYNRLLPVGVPGHLCVVGDGLAGGYLNRPELTSEKFIEPGRGLGTLNEKTETFSVPSVSSVSSVDRLYKTGDQARWLPDGNIEFLGRIDTQVKIRGFRIEVSEIEKTLTDQPDIEEAVVLALDGENNEKYLCAYLVAQTEVPVSQLRGHLEKSVPGYMIPSYFIYTEKIPLTPNGKVDKRALKALGGEGTGAAAAEVEYVAPETGLEKTIAAIWQEVLQLENVGIHANFFELGGNSLKIIQVNTKLNEALKKEIPVMTLFEHTTIHALAEHLRKDNEEENFHEMVVQREQDMDEGKARMKQRMRRRGSLLDD
jgi:amino acid adenylation domain-containing protein